MEIERLIRSITEEVYSNIARNNTQALENINDGYEYSKDDIISKIDHTLLKPDATVEDIQKLCREAKAMRFAAVCIAPPYVPLAFDDLRGSGVKVCTTVGYPYGASSTKTKLSEAKEAIENGAEEIELYINTAVFKSKDYDSVNHEIKAIIDISKSKAKVKVVYESGLLNEEEKIRICTMAKNAGADYIMISTALGTAMANTEEVEFVKRFVGNTVGIKVDGAIRDYETALCMLRAGATKIGTSYSIDIANRYATGRLTSKAIAKMIDHSLLHPGLTDKELKDECEVAKKYNVASVCVKPYHVAMSKEYLKWSDVLVCAVIGFPHGNNTIDIKVKETEQVICDGATEVDMVINIGKALSEDWDYIEQEIKAVKHITNMHNAVLKVIFENDLLPEDKYKIRLCQICSQLKVEYVKTSTGYNYVKEPDGRYSYKGATEHDLKLMRQYCLPDVAVKAAGSVGNLEAILKAREIGVTRIGTKSTIKIIEDAKLKFGE